MFGTVKLVFLLILPVVLCKPSSFAEKTKKCGYDACHPVDPNKMNVHMVAHSHDDVGWLKTVDQLYFGTNYSHQWAGVQYIIDSVVSALNENSDRKFIQVEIAFFWKWWKEQDDKTKALVRKLVNSGQLEIAGGGWSMNDEAAVHYQSIIDQFTLGFKTVKDLLGDCARPKIGWQIDPFGHTREMASIFSHLGFDGLFFTRLDYRDIIERHKNLNTEFMWRGNPSLGGVSDIFTSLIYRFYNAPDYFCWDIVCGDEPIVEDEESPLYNVERRVNDFAKYIDEQASKYRTPNILITMGGDFTHQHAHVYYKNIDKLIRGFKKLKNDTYNIIYSTPACYMHAVNQYANDMGLDFSLKTDDFMPLASDEHSYWTGYYTSRPNSKRFERQANNLLQVTKQLMAFALNKGVDFNEDLVKLKEIMGVMQHHDAITGTEKQHVTDDYVRMLTIASEEAEKHISDVIRKLLEKHNAPRDRLEEIPLKSCLLSNVSRCAPSAGDRFVVAVYNPLSRKISSYVRLPVPGQYSYKVTGPNGRVISDTANTIDTFEEVPGTPSPWDLIFRAEEIPPMGMKLYVVEKGEEEVTPNIPTQSTSFGTDKIKFSIDPQTGFLNNIAIDGHDYPVNQQFMFYQGAAGFNTKPFDRASGAYIFRPDPKHPEATPITNATTSIKIFEGKLFYEVHQTFNPWVKQVIRYYKGENHVEFDWVVGPIEPNFPVGGGVEVISRFTTDLKSSQTFYTDSNGRGLIKRVLNFRETFPYTNEEPVSGNYYPVTSRIVLRDAETDVTMALLTDRPEGGSSLRDGEVELMVHRRLFYDDDFGVKEPLNEYEFGKGVRVRGRHYLVVGSGESAAAIQHEIAQRKHLEPWIFVGEVSETDNLDILETRLDFEFSGLAESLPENVQVLTLEKWDSETLLLRLEHIFEKDEHTELSKSVDVNIQELFSVFEVTSATEMTLGANQRLRDNQKLEWNYDKRDSSSARSDTDLIVTLHPMEIRTFLIKFKAIQ